MRFTFGFKVSRMSFFGGCKISDAVRLVVDRNVCSPLVVVFNNPHKPRFVSSVWLSYVLRIARLINNSKVAESVVSFVAVDMVNQPVRPFSGDVKPCQPMSLVNLSVESDSDIAKLVGVSSDITNMNAFGGSFQPSKLSGVGVKMKNLFKLIGGKVGNKHGESPELVSYINTGIIVS
jgi:hypothetical protein